MMQTVMFERDDDLRGLCASTGKRAGVASSRGAHVWALRRTRCLEKRKWPSASVRVLGEKLTCGTNARTDLAYLNIMTMLDQSGSVRLEPVQTDLYSTSLCGI
jgi:hypothetical protein